MELNPQVVFERMFGSGSTAEQRMLRREYQKDYDKHVDFDALKPGYEAAMARARRLDADAEEVGEPGRNPTTGFHRLTASIAGE